MTVILTTVLRSLFAIFSLIFLARVNGAKQVSQMSFYDYVIGISIGSMTAIMAIDAQIPFYLPLISITIFIIANFIEGKITIHSLKLRKIIEGVPLVLIEDGCLIQKNIKKAQLTVNDILSEARLAGYFNLQEILYAIMEISGKISFLPMDKYSKNIKKNVENIQDSTSLFISVIIDGVILEDELKCIGKNMQWLNKECSLLHYQTQNILLAVANQQGHIFIWEKQHTSKYDNIFI